MKDYFPLKLAQGDSFCNRLAEQAKLKRNVELNRSTVMISPRRYGKSSLAHKVVNDIKLPAAFIDLFLANDDRTVTMRILEGVGDLVSQIMPMPQKAIEIVQEYFSSFNFSFSVKGAGVSISFKAKDSDDFDPAKQVHEALKSLSNLAEKKSKKVVIFIDEFQDIINAESARTIEGAIRSVAQETNNIAFIFSGSNRHLLLNLFDDKNKPLYMLCDKILLDRMSSSDYRPYVQKAAIEKWGSELKEDVFASIMGFTELHPFYVNMLGNELWQYKKLPDSKEIVSEAWERCFNQEKMRLVSEIENLANNQQKALKYLAGNPSIELYSRTVLAAIGLSNASMSMAIKSLLEKDWIYRLSIEDPLLSTMKKNQYRVLDPLLGYALRKHFS